MTIRWAVHVNRPPGEVFDALDSDAGRAGFWAESADERDNTICFVFINGTRHQARVLSRLRPHQWTIEYFGGRCSFRLEDDGRGGTDVRLEHEVTAEAFAEVSAGWLNVLLPMKVWIQHGIDIRNHDPARSWDQGFVDQ
jgi:hypothetical protein